VIANDFVSMFVQIMREFTNPNYLQAAVRAAGNIATGTDAQTQRLIEYGILPVLGMHTWFKLMCNHLKLSLILDKLLEQNKESLVREVCWLVSNIAAGNQQQLETLVQDHTSILAKVSRLVVGSGSVKTRKEAAWCLCNALTGSSSAQLKRVVETGALTAMTTVLYQTEEKLLAVRFHSSNMCEKVYLYLIQAAIAAFSRTLSVGREECQDVRGENVYAKLVADSGAAEKLRQLKDSSASASISLACHELLAEHFPNLIASSSSTGTNASSLSTNSAPHLFVFKR